MEEQIRENLNKLRNIKILCRYERSFIIKDFVQVVLKIISDEPDYIAENYLYFDDKSIDSLYIKAEYFKEILEREMYFNYDLATLDNICQTLDGYLEDKLIIVNPYYYFNEGKQVYFKNGTISDIIPLDNPIDIEDCNYYIVPVIRNANTFDSFKNKQEFPLLDVSKKLMGAPEYLCYGKRIFTVDIDVSKTNEQYWKANDGENSIIERNIDYDNLVRKKEIIEQHDSDFIFVSKASILSSKKIENKENDVDAENEEWEKIAYEDTKEVKVLQQFWEYTKNKNLCYTENDIYNFYTCVRSSQLIILAGMSGTGKTKLPLKFAEYFNMKESEEDATLLFVPVSPAFTEPSDILGYLNPNTGIYTSSETRLVEFLKHAEKHKEKMHMVIFDEMNLAQIEFWFAPFISILEKDLKERKLYLYSKTQRCINESQYPCSINIGTNVIFVGTINLDETTKNISDRLLDRSFIINLKKESFLNYHGQQSSRQKNDLKKFDEDFIQFMPDDEFESDYISIFNFNELKFFDDLHILFNKIDPQKGVSFRNVKNIALYLKYRPETLDRKKAFDYALKQTVLKKVNGTIESIGDFVGDTIDEKRNTNGSLIKIFDEYPEISDFNESRQEIANKLYELRKYGYAR